MFGVGVEAWGQRGLCVTPGHERISSIRVIQVNNSLSYHLLWVPDTGGAEGEVMGDCGFLLGTEATKEGRGSA